jgi:hypothetical protein
LLDNNVPAASASGFAAGLEVAHGEPQPVASSRTGSLPLPLRLAAWTAAFLLAFWLMLQWNTTVVNDFTQNVWLPSRLVLDGVNPYDPTRAQVDLALGSYAGEFTRFNGGPEYYFIYPVWAALAFSPFAAMPLAFATALWRALNLLLLVWGVAHVLRATNPSFRSLRAPVLGALAFTLLLAVFFRDSFITLFAGQFSIIEFGILAAIWGYLLSSARAVGSTRLVGDALTGIGLAVLATKPQAMGLAVVLLFLWALVRKRYVIAMSAAASMVVLLGVPALFYDYSLSGWFDVLFGGKSQATTQMRVSASVWGVSYQWLGWLGSVPWMVVAGALTLVGLLVLVPWWRRDLTDRTSAVPLSLALTLCINSVISPYMLGYEHVLLFFPALVLLAASGAPGGVSTPERNRWPFAIYIWMAVLPFLVLALQATLDREYVHIAQSATMLALCLIGRLNWRGEMRAAAA